VANPNRYLGRIWKKLQKYGRFGPIFDKSCDKTLKILKNHRVSIQDWAVEISNHQPLSKNVLRVTFDDILLLFHATNCLIF
jgi:hypothetical protein